MNINLINQNTYISKDLFSQANSNFHHSKENYKIMHNKKETTSQVSFRGHLPFLRMSAKILGFLNALPISLSEYDTPFIKQIRKEILLKAGNEQSTHKIHTPEREHLRAQIINRFLQQVGTNINQGRNFYMIIGLPGAGKSTLSHELSKEKNALHIDYDAIKHQIPEFQKDKTFNLVVSRETSEIINKLVDVFTQSGHDIIIENTGKNLSSIIKILKQVKAKGYNIHLKIIHLEPKEAFERTMPRFEETGRFSDPIFHCVYGRNSLTLHRRLLAKMSEYFSSCELYSSNVPKGHPFKLLEKNEAIP